ncbi:hypothetical protein C8A05DRAFT_33478 [Staphylotrichum tortipilum]|uniref:Uncharacterized protein n=1 Tax=Staphylotrichum tortipilum TaxID=2831512 RepID=A0AAN6RUC0_9PEZI|nr:hypothetical protein C8A05DRAFT_33478 [Staphylotrichum longicolle]
MRSLEHLDNPEGSLLPSGLKTTREPSVGPHLNVPEASRNAPAPFVFALRPTRPPKTPFRPPSGEDGSLFERPAATISWPDASPFPRALLEGPTTAGYASREAALPRAPITPTARVQPHGSPRHIRETLLGDLGFAPKRGIPGSRKGSTAGGAPAMPAAANNAARPPQGHTTAARAAQGSSISSHRLPAPPPHPHPLINDPAQPTRLLSEECQRRSFNPVITTRETRSGLFIAYVVLADHTVSTDRTFPSAYEARQAVARKALEVVRAWPIPPPGPPRPPRERDRRQHPQWRDGGGGGIVKTEGGGDGGSRMRDLPAANARPREITSPNRTNFGRQATVNQNRTTAMEMPAANNHAQQMPPTLFEQMQQQMLRSNNIPADTDAARIFIEGMVAGARAAGFFEQTLSNAAPRRGRSRSPGKMAFDAAAGSATTGGGGQYRARSPLRGMEVGEANSQGLPFWVGNAVGFGAYQPGGRQGREGGSRQCSPPMPMDRPGEFQGPAGFALWPGRGGNSTTHGTAPSNTSLGSNSGFGTPVPPGRVTERSTQLPAQAAGSNRVPITPQSRRPLIPAESNPPHAPAESNHTLPSEPSTR